MKSEHSSTGGGDSIVTPAVDQNKVDSKAENCPKTTPKVKSKKSQSADSNRKSVSPKRSKRSRKPTDRLNIGSNKGQSYAVKELKFYSMLHIICSNCRFSFLAVQLIVGGHIFHASARQPADHHAVAFVAAIKTCSHLWYRSFVSLLPDS